MMRAESPKSGKVDMSPEAIDERFRLVESLRKLAVSLKEAGEQSRLQTATMQDLPRNPQP